MEMLCPKCHGLMRQYERNGVVVEQCTGCKGIFLDRGELDHLLDAEAAFNTRRAAPAPPPPRERRHDDRRPRYDDRDRYYDDRRHRGDKYYKKRKRKSLIEELFDF